jgi:hypothetical protein
MVRANRNTGRRIAYSGRDAVNLRMVFDHSSHLRHHQRPSPMLHRPQLHCFQLAAHVQTTCHDHDGQAVVDLYRALQHATPFEVGSPLNHLNEIEDLFSPPAHTLLIGVNDSDSVLRRIPERIRRDLGREVPWHISGYFPTYRFAAPSAPIRTVEDAWQVGREAGLEFVYIGNAAGDPYENTYCPACERALIRRLGFDVVEYSLDAGRCPGCDWPVAGA